MIVFIPLDRTTHHIIAGEVLGIIMVLDWMCLSYNDRGSSTALRDKELASPQPGRDCRQMSSASQQPVVTWQDLIRQTVNYQTNWLSDWSYEWVGKEGKGRGGG